MNGPSTRALKAYLRTLSVLYFVGGLLHLADLLDLRLEFSKISLIWQAWIVYLFAFDLAAGVGLWRYRCWGAALFLVVAFSQLLAYLGYMHVFGDQDELVLFHVITVTVFGLLVWRDARVSGKAREARP